MGHVRDLPKKKLGVDVKKGFAAEYEVLATQEEDPRRAEGGGRRTPTAIYLAADPDREGEAICWHLAEELVPKARRRARPRRSTAWSSTRSRSAPSRRPSRTPTQVDAKKVDAQQARRVLDRLVGYKVSPILWDKVRRGLSAGRVQSRGPAAHLRPRAGDPRLRARGVLDGRGPARWASSRPVFPANLAQAATARASRSRTARRRPRCGRDLEAAAFRVEKVQAAGAPAQPRAALHHEQAAAGGLPQAGLPRTQDHAGGAAPVRGHRARGRRARWVSSPTCAPTPPACRRRRARRGARPRSREAYGDDYVPEKPNVYKAKKDAQDAHEAIRPSYLERDPESVKKFLSKDELKALHPHLEPLRGLPDAARGLRRDRGRHRGHPPARPPSTSSAPRARP